MEMTGLGHSLAMWLEAYCLTSLFPYLYSKNKSTYAHNIVVKIK